MILCHADGDAHQALISEGVIYAPDEEPEGPEVLKPELQHKIGQQYQRPNHQELQIQEGAETQGGWERERERELS